MCFVLGGGSGFGVALLAEGVDRNRFRVHLRPSKIQSPSSRRAWIEIKMSHIMPRALQVALLAEGVDRNMYPLAKATRPLVSPSSRRAWIEISQETLQLVASVSRPPRGGRG